jgi:hypothetical protein
VPNVHWQRIDDEDGGERNTGCGSDGSCQFLIRQNAAENRPLLRATRRPKAAERRWAGNFRRARRHDRHGLLNSDRPNPDKCGGRDLIERLNALLHANGGERSVGSAEDMNQPPLDPEPPLLVEMPDVASPMPSGIS